MAVAGTPDREGLCVHDLVLSEGDVRLRPMTEEDWGDLRQLVTDRDVAWFAEGDDWVWTRQDLQSCYRAISGDAHMFVVEYQGSFAGECWLQAMNVPVVTRRHPGLDCR